MHRLRVAANPYQVGRRAPRLESRRGALNPRRVRELGDERRRCDRTHAAVEVLRDRREVGQVIGYVGSSGNSGTPHLHFEVHEGQRGSAYAVDPVAFMRSRGAALGAG
jgi:hypothetical protein